MTRFLSNHRQLLAGDEITHGAFSSPVAAFSPPLEE
jgi:hypothetical protein